MSDYGLHIINDSGDVLIDSLYANYAFSETITASAISDRINRSIISITNTSQSLPLICLRGDSPDSCAFVAFIKDASGFYSGFTVNVMEPFGTIRNLKFDVFLPSDELTLPVGGYGLIVKGPSGNTVFHSDYQYLKIQEIVSVSSPNFNTVTEVMFSFNTVSMPIFILNSFKGYATYSYDLGIECVSTTSAKLKWIGGLNLGAGVYYPSLIPTTVSILVCSLSA